MTGGKWLLLIKGSATLRSQRSGRAARAKTGPAGLRATLQVATTAATLDNPREQTCALIRNGGPKKCGPRQACRQDDSSSDGRDGRDGSWVMQDQLRGPSLGKHAGLASPKLHQGRKCQADGNLVWANRERTFEVPLENLLRAREDGLMNGRLDWGFLLPAHDASGDWQIRWTNWSSCRDEPCWGILYWAGWRFVSEPRTRASPGAGWRRRRGD